MINVIARSPDLFGTTRQSLPMNKQYYVYLITNDNNTVIYAGVTNDLKRRVYEHKEKLVKGFTKRYNINKLVYYEVCGDVIAAISREKQLKSLLRSKKNELVIQKNPYWHDLYDGL
jgi:putative endonuclease